MIEKHIEAEEAIGKVIPSLSQVDLRKIVYYREQVIAILQKIDGIERVPATAERCCICKGLFKPETVYRLSAKVYCDECFTHLPQNG
jgi:hypothetical protein